MVPTDAAVAGHAAAMAGDAVADAVDAAELLGIDVDEFARPLPLIADRRELGVERPQPAEPEAAQHGADRGDGHAEPGRDPRAAQRSEEHTSELQSLMRISYAVFCLKKKK